MGIELKVSCLKLISYLRCLKGQRANPWAIARVKQDLRERLCYNGPPLHKYESLMMCLVRYTISVSKKDGQKTFELFLNEDSLIKWHYHSWKTKWVGEFKRSALHGNPWYTSTILVIGVQGYAMSSQCMWKFTSRWQGPAMAWQSVSGFCGSKGLSRLSRFCWWLCELIANCDRSFSAQVLKWSLYLSLSPHIWPENSPLQIDMHEIG